MSHCSWGGAWVLEYWTTAWQQVGTVDNRQGWWTKGRDNEQQAETINNRQGTMNNGQGWQTTGRDDKQWAGTPNNGQGWPMTGRDYQQQVGMTNNGQGWWSVGRDDERTTMTGMGTTTTMAGMVAMTAPVSSPMSPAHGVVFYYIIFWYIY